MRHTAQSGIQAWESSCFGLPAAGATTDFAVVAGRGVRTVSLALFVVATGTVMGFPGGRCDPIARIFGTGGVNVAMLV